MQAGEIHALMGENGAGKSTFIKVLTGVFPRDAGETRLEGKIIAPKSPREAEALGISTVYQEVNLIPHLSVAENICLGRQPTWLGAIRWGAIAKRAGAALARLDLSLDLKRQLSSYSIAIQQMVAIARALDISAKLLILDEPTSSLDKTEVEELFKKLRKLREDRSRNYFHHPLSRAGLRNLRLDHRAAKWLPGRLFRHQGPSSHQTRFPHDRQGGCGKSKRLEQKRASTATIRSDQPMLEAQRAGSERASFIRSIWRSGRARWLAWRVFSDPAGPKRRACFSVSTGRIRAHS